MKRIFIVARVTRVPTDFDIAVFYCCVQPSFLALELNSDAVKEFVLTHQLLAYTIFAFASINFIWAWQPE